MKDNYSDQNILNETPDFEYQKEILQEEKKENQKVRKKTVLICCMFILSCLVLFTSYSKIYEYRNYGTTGSDKCENVNIKKDGSKVPNINITDGNDCIPKYNIDYYNNRIALFNVDVFGDKSFIFNKTNQMDETNTYCILNCDSDNDGWPDYNIDLDGNGTADINVIKDRTKKDTCDLFCDINFDMMPDTNIDIDGDGIPDINITEENYKIPKYNIDYKNNRKPIFNIKDENNNLINPVNDATNGKKCERNCDIDGDGWPDYNIVLEENSQILNEFIKDGNKDTTVLKHHTDWKCTNNPKLTTCEWYNTKNNLYINIDYDGDGIPDINLSNDNGNTLNNKVNKDGLVDGIKMILNEDVDGDGFPDINIDLNNDGIPDINITDNKKVCIKNCDTNGDGKSDSNIPYGDNIFTLDNINIDIDYDGICDINCDLNGDRIVDYNIDTDGDYIPDVNIDYNGDKIPDFNIDTNGDGIPDENLDAYSVGECNFNCNENGRIENPVNSGEYCLKNCDTNNDGWPDKNVDINNDGICDFNCTTGEINEDKDNDYYLDTRTSDNKFDITVAKGEEDTIYIINPLEIKSDSIEPGWSDNYILTLTNTTQNSVKYQIKWENVYNEFTQINNLNYFITKNGSKFLADLKAPYNDIVLKDTIIIKSGVSIKYVMNLEFAETGINQNIDSNKNFRGKLIINKVD